MEDRTTLQFILDTVQRIGGAPHNLEQVQEDALDLEIAGKVPDM